MAIQINDVKARLEQLGCQVDAVSDTSLVFAIDKVTNKICNNCNVSEIPDRLKEIAIDMVCGEYLFARKATGQSVGEIIDDVERVIKSIQEGNTKVDFSDTVTPESRFNALLGHLLHENDLAGDFARYRRISW